MENFKGEQVNKGQGNEKEKNGDDKKNLISIVFIVNGKQTTVEKANLNQPLHVSAQKALEQTSNTLRPLSDWLIKYNDKDLTLSAKVEDLHLPEGAKIFMSLKSAEGGRK